MILAGHDDFIDNDACKEFMKKCKTKDSEVLMFESTGHSLSMEEPYVRDLAKGIIGWLDSHI